MVEDNLVNQSVQIRTLQSLGYDCVVASNGKEGFDLFASDPSSFDIILMDFQMPIMDGFEATAQMRLFESQHSLPHSHIIGFNSGLFPPLLSSSLSFFSDHLGSLSLFTSVHLIREKHQTRNTDLHSSPLFRLASCVWCRVVWCDRMERQPTNQPTASLQETKEKSTESGMCDVMFKPVRKQDLADTLCRYMEEDQSGCVCGKSRFST